MLTPMKKTSAYTLIEIMITMVVLISISMLAVFTMSNYMPKQRLLDSLETTEQMLSRAQVEATSRSTWSCIKYTAATGTLSLYMDSDTPYHGAAAACGTGSDLLITTQILRANVGFAPSGNSGCTGTGSSGPESSFDFSSGEVWFDTAGVPKTCSAGSCVAKSFSFILTSSDIASGNKAREVEAVSSGLIAIVNRGEMGYGDGVYAKTGTLPNGCE